MQVACHLSRLITPLHLYFPSALVVRLVDGPTLGVGDNCYENEFKLSVVCGKAHLIKQYPGHHALVFVAQQMTVEERYSPDDGVRKVHH